ncbi:MAG: phytoene desaturase family protein [Armatimonadota bacterium]
MTTKQKTARSGERAVIIGSGFAGMAAACSLAQGGLSVTVLEKNDQIGGRARVWEQDGFTFDMGPSWYWMPDIFEKFFARFGKKPSDYYDLVRLDPGYRVYFGKDQIVDVAADMSELEAAFEQREPGSAAKLREYLSQAAYKYSVGMGDYVWRPSLSIFEFMDARMIGESIRIQMLQPLHKHAARYFKDSRLLQIIEFPVLFLGGTAHNIPAMYSMMNHADLVLGTWYPMGGMRKIADAMSALAFELGVTLRTETEARRIVIENGRATGVQTVDEMLPADWVVAGGDYHHIEQNLIDEPYRNYTEAQWDKRVLSPSSLLFYLGVNKKLAGLEHHNLFFDEGLDQHAREIYDDPKWPTRPLFYVCCASKTDPSAAPEGMENVFILIPTAVGLDDPHETREYYYNLVMDRLEAMTGQSIRDAVVVKRSYAHREFGEDYYSYKGNAYGLANTLPQTAFFKPSLRARKVDNLLFAGQLTVPGPGVPPSLISGQVAANVILGRK